MCKLLLKQGQLAAGIGASLMPWNLDVFLPQAGAAKGLPETLLVLW